MHKRKWNLIFAGSRDSRDARALGVPRPLVAVLVLIALVGLAGFGRVVYLGLGYAYAVYNVAEQRRDNERLKGKIESLERFVKQETDVILRLAAFEDSARMKYGLEAISSDVRKAGVGGFPSREDILYSEMTDPLIVMAEALRLQASALSHQAELQESTFSQVTAAVRKVHGDLAQRPSIWPTNGRLTSTFGFRYHPFSGLRLMHEGIDIANNPWTPIYATADGQVKEVSSWTHFGNMVKISHNNGRYITLYAHMQKAAVTAGQFVKRGDVIGYMGSTGRSTGPHLHYEVHREGRPVDPMQFIVAVDQIVD
jgi:murein DD-endopeptidase MepM/ murein hydrolase activator NlpD